MKSGQPDSEPERRSFVEVRDELLSKYRSHGRDECYRLLELLRRLVQTRTDKGWYLLLAGRLAAQFESRRIDTAWRYYVRARPLLTGDLDGLGAAVTVMVSYLFNHMEYEAAQTILDEWWQMPFARSSRFTPQLCHNHGLVLFRLQEFAGSAAYLQEAIGYYQDRLDCQCYLGGTWYTLGQVRRAQGDAKGALDALQRAEALFIPGEREWVFMARAWLDLLNGDALSAHVNYHLAVVRLKTIAPAFAPFLQAELGLLSIALAEEGGAVEESDHLRRALHRLQVATGQTDPSVNTFQLAAFRRALA